MIALSCIGFVCVAFLGFIACIAILIERGDW